ncbi:MAG TPA: amidase [Burkholderiales bacterium]|jgi:amidase|nr:amidase [Burkholderiales bacterium]
MSSADLCFLPAVELARLIREREVCAVEVMQAHLETIERVNPRVNAIVTLLPERALAGAREIDARLARGEVIGPLAGLPVAHKDLVPTKGIRTTFGSPIYRAFVPDVDAIIVERLRAAGAVTIGKTNTPEFGAGSQTFNPVFGATRNPYDLERTCGGSSGGAAVALACGMMPIADGSDLGGSLRNPASFCNVFGLRPSAGRVPHWPALSAWFPLSVLGPMARTAQDAALMLSAIAGPDPRSPICIEEPGERFAAALERDFRGVRIAWCRDFGGLPFEPEVLRVTESGLGVLESLGCVVEEATPDFRDADEIFRVMRAWHFELCYGELLDTGRALMKDTVVWNIEQGRKLSGAQVAAAERARTQLFHRMRRFMDNCAFLVAPVSQVLPFDLSLPYVSQIGGVRLETYIDWMKSCYWVSVTGQPAASVPCGFSAGGLPVGIQIVGRYRDDFGVLQLAHAFEQATGFWKQKPPLAAGSTPTSRV